MDKSGHHRRRDHDFAHARIPVHRGHAGLCNLSGVERTLAASPCAAARRVGFRLAKVYRFLIPLYREAHMAASIVSALERLDWPTDKRDILFITEADDTETRIALQAEIHGRAGYAGCGRSAGFTPHKAARADVCPAAGNRRFCRRLRRRRRPRAQSIVGGLRPFRGSRSGLGCLQARLNIYNFNKSWMIRQFTLEYTALFDAILPVIERLSLPVLLGGTSVHFVRDVLEDSGGWDPYNVTEDADLGIRLARQGVARRNAELHHLGRSPAHQRNLARSAHPVAQRLDADVAGASTRTSSPVVRSRPPRLHRLQRAHGRRYHIRARAPTRLRLCALETLDRRSIALAAARLASRHLVVRCREPGVCLHRRYCPCVPHRLEAPRSGGSPSEPCSCRCTG